MRALAHPAAKPLALLLGLLPALWLFWAAATDQLGANPAEALIRGTGDWTLRTLCLALAVTPLRQALGKGEPYVADAALSQIRIYEALAVRPDHVRAALDVLQQASSSQPPLGPAHPALWMPRATRALLFVGQ